MASSPMTNPPTTKYERLAALGRAVRAGDTEYADHLRTEIRADALATKIREAVAKAPPLSPEQLDRLANLLRPGGAA